VGPGAGRQALQVAFGPVQGAPRPPGHPGLGAVESDLVGSQGALDPAGDAARAQSEAVLGIAGGGERGAAGCVPGLVESGEVGPHLVHQGAGGGGGGLQGGVGHLVGHRPVDLVADAGEDGHRGGGDGPGQGLVVEHRQVGGGPAAPHQQHGVDRAAGGAHGVAHPAQGGHDLGGGVGPLGAHVQQPHRERQAAPRQLRGDVGVGGGARAGDEGHPERHGREAVGPVGVEQALGLECGQHPVAVGLEPAEGELGVDGAHAELQHATGLVPAQPGLDADLQPVLHADGPAGPLELVVHQGPFGGQEGDSDQRAGGGTHRARFGEVEVHVAVGRPLQVADLPAHPQVGGEGLRRHPGDAGRQFADRERGGPADLVVEQAPGAGFGGRAGHGAHGTRGVRRRDDEGRTPGGGAALGAARRIRPAGRQLARFWATKSQFTRLVRKFPM
jgi:hypothetical protein